MKCGLLYISQESALIGDVSYHDYQGILVDTQERELIARDLGPVNKVRKFKYVFLSVLKLFYLTRFFFF